ncbi:hypothetical protein LguiA_028216 [Lonicera macranthoides]
MEFSANPFLFLDQNLAKSKTELREFLIPKFKFSYHFSVDNGLGINIGREAAAVTEDEDMGCCLDEPPPPPPPPQPSFVTDHPFMFMIREYNSATPFFIGLVFNPLLDD